MTLLRLHIESLSLEGVDISRSQRPRLQAALEAELVRLFTVQGVPESLQQGGRIPRLPTQLTFPDKPTPTDLGQAIARSIYSDLNPGGMHHGSTPQAAASSPSPNAFEPGTGAAGQDPKAGHLGE